MAQVPQGYQPPTHQLPQAPGPGTAILLERLDLIERKIDWIARRLMLTTQVPEPAPARQTASASSPDTDAEAVSSPDAVQETTARPEPASAAQATSSSPGIRAQDTEQNPSEPQPAPIRTAGGALGYLQPAPVPEPQVPVIAQPSAAPVYSRPVQQAPIAAPDAPTWWDRARTEGNLGRYLLSGAAALVTVLAGITLIALVWDSIPDVVKILALAVAAGALVAGGTRIASTRPRQRVAAATLCGTGGALGYVSIIGGVLLDGLIPTYPAFALMAVWGIVLLFLSRHTAQVFTAVISTLGALLTIAFAVRHVVDHPQAALLVWSLVLLYLLTLAGTTALLSRTSGELRWAAWYPSTSMVVTVIASLSVPMEPLTKTSTWAGPLLILAGPTLLGVQVLHTGPHMSRHGWRDTVGWDWGIRATTAVLTLLLLHSALGPQVLPFVLVFLTVEALLILFAGAVPLDTQWRKMMRPWMIGGSVATGLLSTGIAPQAVTFACALIAMSACLGAHGGLAWGMLCAAGSSLLPAVVLQSSIPGVPALALAGTVLLLASVLVCEALLPNPLPPQDPGGQEPDQAARGSEPDALPGILSGSMWVSAAVLTLFVPSQITSLTDLSADLERIEYCSLATVLLCLLSLLGLFSPDASLLRLANGNHVLQRPGADENGRPTQANPGAPAVVACLLHAGASFANLALAAGQGLPLAAVLATVALATSVVGGRFLVPWLRSAAVCVGLAGMYTVIAWSSLCVLTGTRPWSVPVSILLLACGAVCVLVGFNQKVTALRHYGLGLVLMSVVKLATVDVAATSAVARILALLVAGAVCFCLSLAYNKLVVDSAQPGSTDSDAPAHSSGQFLPTAPVADPGPGGSRPAPSAADTRWRRPGT